MLTAEMAHSIARAAHDEDVEYFMGRIRAVSEQGEFSLTNLFMDDQVAEIFKELGYEATYDRTSQTWSIYW